MMRQVLAVHHRRESGVDAALRLEELFPRQALDVGDSVARDAELLEELIGGLRGVGFVGDAQRRSALHRGAVEQTPGGRRGQERRRLRAAADWPKIITRDGSPPNAAMLSRTHSSDATMSITPQTPALLEFLRRADRCQMRVAEAREPVVHRDDDDVAEQGELAAVVHRSVGGSGREAAAVERDEHGALAVVVDARRADVERQAVFAHAAAADVAIPHDELRVVARGSPTASAARSVHTPWPGGRRSRRAGFRGGMKRFWRRRVGAVRNAAKHLDAGVRHATHDTVRRLDVEEERPVGARARCDGRRSARRLRRRLRLGELHAAGAGSHEAREPGFDDAAPRPVHCLRPLSSCHGALRSA